ncbi:unnamed protein product [Bursaphelenchus okinawaensis]|uniref:Polypeptide N-acetylgalactosaminyltransferase n=1 Tax=Bursaphelenchus okinawaensis TaxID=465554 RepID=A0A811KC48_9BILA|nr:unnamed protein product [Bursaphelenchus okinawaensis]CAG9100697.1 unnamed protein product [Bursaphelenchus okinawaensis]
MSFKLLCRFLIPRRFENAVNTILTIVLVICVLYFYNEYRKFHPEKLPYQEGKVWPTTALVLHTKPQVGVERNGPGENGGPVILKGKEKVKGQQDMKTWFMNVVASDKISLDRSVPDSRHPKCKNVKYDNDLPSATVVIIFTDEAWTPLLRTVHSVVNRSPESILKEVVLIDDNSQRPELITKLPDYIKKFGGLVRLVRKTERHGLIRAKIAGAREARGDVVVFLDSHCEANVGWLEPIVQRIKDNPTAVVCPTIDHISAQSMAYNGDPNAEAVGGFWWSLHFKWDPLPESERKRRKNPTEYIRSPTMAGGLLAADRKYFLYVGSYDAEMDIWGGENLEISFRVWMCGGSIEILPCSRVGHIFRDGHPYNMTGRGGNKDVHGTNSKRLAEVWMDDYKRLYYLHRRDLKDKYVGPLEDRHILRKRLKCRSFKWFLDNVTPNKFVPDEDASFFGSVKAGENSLCMDTMQRDEKMEYKLGLFFCQGEGSAAQMMSLTPNGQFRREESCANVETSTREIKMTPCRSRDVYTDWEYDQDSKQLKHKPTGLCIDASGLKSGSNVKVSECKANSLGQQWKFNH